MEPVPIVDLVDVDDSDEEHSDARDEGEDTAFEHDADDQDDADEIIRVPSARTLGLLIGVAAVLGVILISVIVGRNQENVGPSSFSATISPSPSGSPRPTTYQQLLGPGVQRIHTSAVCSSFKQVIDRWDQVASKRLSRIKGVSTDPYEAAAFVKGKRDWLNDETEESFQRAVERIGEERLRTIAGSDSSYVTSPMIYSFTRDAMTACGVSGAWEETKDALDKLDGRTSKLLDAAARKPWHPRLYNAYWADEDIAWRWHNATNECRNTSYAYCWGILVRARYGCSYLYAEVSIRSGKTVIDYSNDTISGLRSGEPAELSFLHFGSGRTLTASLNQISCR